MPIHVKRVNKKTVFENYYTNKFIFKPRDDQYISIVFNNATGAAKRQGATTIMEILECHNLELTKMRIESEKGTKRVYAKKY